MQYLLLIYANEAEADKMREVGVKEMMDAYRSFTQSIIEKGNFKAGDALQRTSNATTVRVRNGKTMTTDGPFAETREQLQQLLSDRGQGPGRGDIDRSTRSVGQVRLDRGTADHGLLIMVY